MKMKPISAALLMAPALALTVSLGAQAAGHTHSGTAATAPAAKAGAHPVAKRNDIRASELIGKNVTNPKGEGLGEIKDLVVDTTTGDVRYAVISFGGFMGLGDKLFAYPLEKFQRGAGDDRGKLVLNVDKEKMKSAPGFEDKSWPDFNKADYRTQVDRFYGTKQTAATVRMARASRIIAGDVKDRSNNDIGDIEDLVVNLDSGKVHYVVLEFDRAWNPDNKLVAMPLKALKAEDRDGSDLVYVASREELKGAPSFEKTRWPDFRDDRFHADVDRYSQTWTNNPAARPEHMQRSNRAPEPQRAAPAKQ